VGNERIRTLRESILKAFPAKKYEGNITRYDDKVDDPELDDEKELYEALVGRTWAEVPKHLLRNQPDGYELLTDEAFAVFLPAWLMSALENVDGENEVRNFVVYAFSPKHDMTPDTTEFTLRRLRGLSLTQRVTLVSVLREFAEHERNSYRRRLAFEAVALVDGLS
jgi:hypothetical protein